MSKSNFLFFINNYSDLCQTSAPALNNFKWSREVNGVPYTLENSQQIQVLPSNTSPNIVPYPFSTPTNSGSYSINSTATMTLNSTVQGIAPGNLIVGAGIPVGTTVLSLGATQYTFTVSAANASVGAVYSNNGQKFTVSSTITGGTTLLAAGKLDPLASGTLTLVSGTGDATIAFSAFSEVTTLSMSRSATVTATETISFYNAASFIYLESDQPVSVIYNNGSPMALEPFEINGKTLPGVFVMNGPTYSLTINNYGTLTANILFASMG